VTAQQSVTVPAMPAEPPHDHGAASGRRDRWLRTGVVAVLVASVALRFLTRSPMWLDEAQTVNIAHRSLPHLFKALREDGSPPLFYVLLHYWMAVFGTSSFAVRSMSSLFAVASLPAIGVAARRFKLIGGSPWPAVLLLATCPFAVRYASEARMYSLVLLLVILALLAYERVWRVGDGWSIAAATLVTAALVLTQYWSLFLILVAGVGALIAVRRGAQPAWRLLVPMVIGCLAFIPWLPSFAYQSAHTGAPWGAPPGVELAIIAPLSWAGDGLTAPPLRWIYYILIALAVAGSATAGGLRFGGKARRRPLLLLGLAAGTLLVGTVASEISSSAYSPRYSTIVLAPLILVMAAGFEALPARARVPSLAVVTAIGLIGSAQIPSQLRTQAGQVAKILHHAGPNDLVVFCPDQLGPAVYRITPNAGRQVVYPTFGSPAIVDWVDYAKRNDAANAFAFARAALKRSAGHTIWLVYNPGYPTLTRACASLATSFTVARGRPVIELRPDGAFENEFVDRFAPASP
jgi:uncharacterized membrane protein